MFIIQCDGEAAQSKDTYTAFLSRLNYFEDHRPSHSEVLRCEMHAKSLNHPDAVRQRSITEKLIMMLGRSLGKIYRKSVQIVVSLANDKVSRFLLTVLALYVIAFPVYDVQRLAKLEGAPQTQNLFTPFVVER